jgi:hypothetical protein
VAAAEPLTEGVNQFRDSRQLEGLGGGQSVPRPTMGRTCPAAVPMAESFRWSVTVLRHLVARGLSGARMDRRGPGARRRADPCRAINSRGHTRRCVLEPAVVDQLIRPVIDHRCEVRVECQA